MQVGTSQQVDVEPRTLLPIRAPTRTAEARPGRGAGTARGVRKPTRARRQAVGEVIAPSPSGEATRRILPVGREHPVADAGDVTLAGCRLSQTRTCLRQVGCSRENCRSASMEWLPGGAAGRAGGIGWDSRPCRGASACLSRDAYPTAPENRLRPCHSRGW